MNPDLSRSRAILIGNATYRPGSGISDLPAASRSVTAMTELLTGELCGWSADRIEPMVDVAAPHELARRIAHAVKDVQDVLLLYYVGHGLRTTKGQLALALGDSDADPALLPHTAILYENLAEVLRGSPAATKLVVLDCCHAELGNRANFLFQSADLAETYPIDGLYFIGASKMHEKAKTPLDGPLTYFTQNLIATIEQGIPGKPGFLALDQIFVELRSRMIRLKLPEPVESGTRGARSFAFARNAAPPQTHADLGPADAAGSAAPSGPSATERQRLLLSRRRLLIATSTVGLVTLGTATWALAGNPAKSPPSPKATSTSPSGAAPDPTATSPSSQPSGRSTSRAVTTATRIGQPLSASNLVTSVAFSPDGYTLVSGSFDNKIQLWNVTAPADPTPIGQPLAVHTGAVNSVTFSPDKHTMASGSRDMTIQLWDITETAHASPGLSLNGHTAGVRSVAFNRDGSVLASGSEDKTIQLWNVAGPSQASKAGPRLTGHGAVVYSVAFSPEGHTLASGSEDSTVWLWDVTEPASPSPIGQPLTGPQMGYVYSVAFSPPDGHVLAAGTLEGAIWLWDTANLAQPKLIGQPLSGHTSSVNAVAFSSDGHTLASGSADGTIRLWDLTDAAHPAGHPLAPGRAINTVAFSSDRKTLASGSDDANILLWKLS